MALEDLLSRDDLPEKVREVTGEGASEHELTAMAGTVATERSAHAEEA